MTPTAGAITSSRSTSIVWLKTIAPDPTPPTTADAGTRQPSRNTCAIGLVRRPIFSIGGPTVRPLGVPRDQEAGDAGEARAAGPRVDDEQVRDRRVGDEGLRAVEDPVAVALDRGRRQGERVRPRVRLGDAGGADRGAVGQPRQPLLLLLLAAELAQRALARGGVGGDREHESVVPRPVADPLQHRDRRQQVLAGAAPLRRDQEALQPELRAGVPQLAGERRPRGRARSPRPPGGGRRTRPRRGAGRGVRRSSRSPLTLPERGPSRHEGPVRHDDEHPLDNASWRSATPGHALGFVQILHTTPARAEGLTPGGGPVLHPPPRLPSTIGLAYAAPRECLS